MSLFIRKCLFLNVNSIIFISIQEAAQPLIRGVEMPADAKWQLIISVCLSVFHLGADANEYPQVCLIFRSKETNY